MGFNYAREKLRFDAMWKTLAVQYSEAGMDEADIQTMRAFDWEWFCQRRTYENHNQMLPSETIDDHDDGSNSNLFKKFPALSVSFDESSFESRYGWIDAVDDPVLSDKLCKLSVDDKELLTLFTFDDYSQKEIAVILRCVQSTVSKKLAQIKKHLL